ncbi:hypothetical protein [Oligoflexus tunisiensis]|uniref:hypothetical protein n=1 Tax=Oligoflexus tunisiensis TaxID=708132 RepID=UPI00114C9411|nr:hypothetical protein [Oligoflexus tunisiensis]
MISRISSWLAFTLAVVTALATSSPTHSRVFAEGSYQVKSDCPNAQTEGVLTITLESVALERTYILTTGTDFGFPDNRMSAGRVYDQDEGDSVTVSSDERVCKAMLWDAQAHSGIFACHRGDELECTIHLEKI